jgi:hypothetical protein
VSRECKLDLDPDEYVEGFKPALMDVVYAWAKGATFEKVGRDGRGERRRVAGCVLSCLLFVVLFALCCSLGNGHLPKAMPHPLIGKLYLVPFHLRAVWGDHLPLSQLCEMTDIFEGSLVRAVRRLDELLGQLANAAEAVRRGQGRGGTEVDVSIWMCLDVTALGSLLHRRGGHERDLCAAWTCVVRSVVSAWASITLASKPLLIDRLATWSCAPRSSRRRRPSVATSCSPPACTCSGEP